MKKIKLMSILLLSILFISTPAIATDVVVNEESEEINEPINIVEEFPEINSSHDTDYSQNITEDILSTENESENESEETVFPEKTVEEKSDEITPMDSSENDNSLGEAHNIDKRDIENTEISNENTLANKSKETEEEVSNAVETFDSNEGELIDSEKEGTLYERIK